MKLIKAIGMLFIIFGLVCSCVGVGLLDQTSVHAGPVVEKVDSSDWGYRQSFTIKGSPDGILTNYQLPIRVYRTTGTDSAEDMGSFTAGKVYVSTNCQPDYDDIRFTRSDGITLLDYWIEESDPNDATIWVEFDSIPTSGNSTFYIYYGNSGASAYSDGDNTFIFFDDFSDESLNVTKWTDLGGNTENGGTIVCAADAITDHGIRSRTAFGTNYAFRANINVLHMASAYYEEQAGWYSADDHQAAAVFSHTNAYVRNKYYNCDDAMITVGDITGDNAATWMVVDIIRNSTISNIYGIDNANIVTLTTNVLPDNAYPEIRLRREGSQITADWVLVRKATPNAPTWGAWGSEEHGLGGSDKLTGVQIGLLSFGLVLMLLGISVLFKGRAKMLVSGAASAVEKANRMPMRTKGIIILVVGAIVVAIAVVMMFV